jgi:hypothetical protein
MTWKNSVSLLLEKLEDRTVPTTITWTGSTLLINNSTGAAATLITLSSTGNNVSVKLGAANATTYNNVGSIVVTGGNGNTTYNLSGITNYAGSLTLTTGNGADSIALGGTGTGNLNLIAGNGSDTLTLAGTFHTNGSFQYTGGNGNNMFTMADGAFVGGNLTISRANFLLGADTIGGTVTITDSQFNFNTSVTLNGTTIGQNLSVTEGNLTDNVALNGTTINGSVGITQGIGNDTFGTSGTTLLGSVNYNAGSGNDTVSLGLTGATSVLGNAYFTLGNGTDVFSSAASIGSLNAQFGSGSDTLTVGGSIFGPASFVLGNGLADSLTVTGSVGGTLSARFGNGSDSMSITPTSPTFYNVNVLFGNLGGFLTLNSNVTISGSVGNTSGGSVNDILDHGTPPATILPNWTFN